MNVITLCGFGVSNYYNKLKLALLEKGVLFAERVVYPWERPAFIESSPLGRIPYIETEHGSLSESQVILEYLEECYPDRPLYPAGTYARAKCRELIQHLELNVEWVARRLYKESFFGGRVSDETKCEVRERLPLGLAAVASLSRFSPYVLGVDFCAADCVAYFHLRYAQKATEQVYGVDMLTQHLPDLAEYMERMEARPSVQRVLAERNAAMAAFLALKVKYDG